MRRTVKHAVIPFPEDPTECMDCGQPSTDPIPGRVNRCTPCAVKAGAEETERLRRERETGA